MQPAAKPMGFKGWNSGDDPLLSTTATATAPAAPIAMEGQGHGTLGRMGPDDIMMEDEQGTAELGIKSKRLNPVGSGHGGAAAAGASTVGGGGGGGPEKRTGTWGKSLPMYPGDFNSGEYMDFGTGEYSDFHFSQTFPTTPYAATNGGPSPEYDRDGLDSPSALLSVIGSPQHNRAGSNFPSPSQGLSGQISEMNVSHDGGDSSANGGTGGSNANPWGTKGQASPAYPHQKAQHSKQVSTQHIHSTETEEDVDVTGSRDPSPALSREEKGFGSLQLRISLERLKEAIPTCAGQTLEPHVILDRALAHITQLDATQAQLLKDIETRNKILGSLNITISDTSTALQNQANTMAQTEAPEDSDNKLLALPTPKIETTAHSPFSTPMMTPVPSAPSSPRVFPRVASREFSQALSEDPNFDEEQFFDAEELPSGWEKGRTKEGRVYYVNHEQKTTSWLDPLTGDRVFGQMPPSSFLTLETLANIPLPPGWEAAVTKDGLPYYIDHTNQRTTWADPRLTVRLPKHLRKTTPTLAPKPKKKVQPATSTQKLEKPEKHQAVGSFPHPENSLTTSTLDLQKPHPDASADLKDGAHRKKQKNGLKSWVVKSPQTYLDDLKSRKPRKKREDPAGTSQPSGTLASSPTDSMQTPETMLTPPEHLDFMESE